MAEATSSHKPRAKPQLEPSDKPKGKVWKKAVSHPLPKWHRHQGSSNDCGPYSVMFVANSLLDAAVIDGDVLASRMEGPPSVRGSLIPLRIRNWATFPWGLVRVLRQAGFAARWRVWVPLRELYANLNRNRATIVIVGDPLRFKKGAYAGSSHYKVLYAWDPDEGFAFVDPAAPEGEAYSYQDEDAFMREWTRMGRQIVEVWDKRRR